MPSTTTLATLLTTLVEDYGLGFFANLSAASTTTLTGATAGTMIELRGPFTGRKIPIGSPVITISETSGAAGEFSYVSDWVPSTGVLTISPAIAQSDITSVIVITEKNIEHPDRLIEAINRALTRQCAKWLMVPLTYVPDGDLLGTTVTDFWTASAGTASYQTTTVPEVAGQRVLQISHSSAATLTGNTIPARANEVWEFHTAIRATTDGDTAALVWRDVVNSADITVSYYDGDGSTTSRSFVSQRGEFTVPGSVDTDGRIAPRLSVSGSGTMTAQMAPIVAFPKDARSFPLQQRVANENRIGNFHYQREGGTFSGPDERGYSEPITQGGRTVSFSDFGDHLVASFNFCPNGPIYYRELVFGTSLSAMADTTIFPAEYVVKWAWAELTKMLYTRERRVGMREESGRPLPSVWKQAAMEAKREAEASTFEPKSLTVVGRR